MSSRDYKHRLLVNLARALKNGAIDADEIASRAFEECADKEDLRDADVLIKRIKKYLKSLLEQQESKNLPLVDMLAEYCKECEELDKVCENYCPVDAIKKDDGGHYYIDHKLCAECGFCVDSCLAGAIVTQSEFARVAAMLFQTKEHPVYAILAPSFAGQFGPEATPESIKSALKNLGFTDVYEVAMAADVLSIFEAQEFIKRYRNGEKFVITSCCCPAFIKLIEKRRPKIVNLVTQTVSPMIALGKMLKKREPNCRVVFIGPCIAKRNEARLADFQPAVDCVLTFKETSALFEAVDLPLTGALGKENLLDASHDGRIYGFSGGVTQAITNAINYFAPDIEVKPVKGNGLKDCNRLLKELEEGNLEGNFMEGMGCPGGCIGGPGCNITVEEGLKYIKHYAGKAPVKNSFMNQKAAEWKKIYADANLLLAPKYQKKEPGTMTQKKKKERKIKEPVEKHYTAAWADMDKKKPVTKVNLPSEEDVRNAKEYVDSNQK
ncbi:MAG TPA: DUF3787 domain-containing protein [Firmicutes bacterium]|nr:DUF3787 domain-containing protein [Bacillota bacterium]